MNSLERREKSNVSTVILTLDYGEGPLLAHRFFNVMKNRISGYFPKVRKKSRSEIENKITSHKFIFVETCSFYQI